MSLGVIPTRSIRCLTQQRTERGIVHDNSMGQLLTDGLAELVANAAAGDDRAWRQLVHRFKRLVFSIPRSYRLSDEACEDVFQTVFTTLVRELPRISDPLALPKWLITTTHRVCWRVSRSDRAAQAAEHQFPVYETLASSDIERWEARAAVDQGLSALGGRCEKLLRLLYLSPTPPPYELVAEQTGMPVGSIGPTRARCLGKLAELVNPPDR